MTQEEAKYLRTHPMKDKLDPKALEAAYDAGWVVEKRTQAKAMLWAIKAYLDAADLVPRSEVKYARVKLWKVLDERDEARREANELAQELKLAMDLAHGSDKLWDERGKQLAALREALTEAQPFVELADYGGGRVGKDKKLADKIYAVLTDTAPEDKA